MDSSIYQRFCLDGVEKVRFQPAFILKSFRSGCLPMVLWLCERAGSANVLVVACRFPGGFSRQWSCLYDHLGGIL